MTEFKPDFADLTPDRAFWLVVSRWRWLATCVAGFAVVGVVYALLAPVEYTTETRLMPEFQAGSAVNLKRFGALAELVGIDLESVSQTEAVRPDLYPDVLTSTPFLLTILNQPVTTTDKKTYPTLTAFLSTGPHNLFTTWLGNAPLAMPMPDSLGRSVQLSKEQEDLLKDVGKRIVSELDPQSGLIHIRVKMPDAAVVAEVCQRAIAYLKRYVIRYRTGKTRTDLQFVTQRRNEAKARYDRALNALSAYADRNRFVYTQSARIEGKRLDAEENLARTLYDELSRNYEQTQLKIQEQTPVFTVLEPPKIPAKRSEPRRALTVLAFMGVGLVLGIGWIVGKEIVAGSNVNNKPYSLGN